MPGAKPKVLASATPLRLQPTVVKLMPRVVVRWSCVACMACGVWRLVVFNKGSAVVKIRSLLPFFPRSNLKGG
jgi:hypothetical protein